MTEPHCSDPSSIVYQRWGVTVHQGDCLDVLRDMADCSIHSVVTDPPAGIRFMNRAWDSDMGGRHSWVAWLSERMAEAYRVLKPGGHALVWAMPRTSHWTAWALEDAGFEVRDCIVHLFGSGFPKSLDVSKAIDRVRDDAAAADRVRAWLNDARVHVGLTLAEVNAHFGHAENGGGSASAWMTHPNKHDIPTLEQWQRLRELLGFGDEMDVEVWRLNARKGTPGHERERQEPQRRLRPSSAIAPSGFGADGFAPWVNEAATDAARQWEGWGTALKPSSEHWWLCRKPLSGTVAANVLAHGTGALNIGATRVGADTSRGDRYRGNAPGGGGSGSSYRVDHAQLWEVPAGRWPPNTVLTHAALLDPETGEAIGDACADGGCVEGCPVLELDRQSGTSAGVRPDMTRHNMQATGEHGIYGRFTAVETARYGDTGGASRFFPQFRWEAKAPTAERPRINGQAHPTVKPRGLMRWMARLVTPPGGTVLDLFAGTGTTGQACIMEGFEAILIENDPESIPYIKARLDARPRDETPQDPDDDEPRDLLDLIDEAS